MLVLRIVAFSVLCCFPLACYTQDCDCEAASLFLKQQVENNYSGFKDKTQGENKRLYDDLTAQLLAKAKTTTKLHYCIGLQKEWLSFFRDGHIRVDENQVPVVNDSVQLLKMIQETEHITLKKQTLKKLKSQKGIEGIYSTVDSTYTIALIKQQSEYRDYVGIIVQSKSPTWKEGEVKLELKSIGNDNYIAYAYYRDHSGHVTNYHFDGTSLNNGAWIKMGAKKQESLFQWKPVDARKLSDSTLYLQIGSFDPWNATAIDSIIQEKAPLLQSLPNLIIDVRTNEGGADFAYAPLIPYIYSQPIKGIGVDVLASEDNINAWLAILKEPDLPESTKDAILRMTGIMKKNIGGFVSIVPDDTLALDEVKPYPKQVVILIDGRCASTTEQFLFNATQSSKVTVMGKPTKGVIDYANVRDVTFPDSPIILSYATTRSRRIDQGMAVDGVGIQPAITLNEKEDWIEAAIRFLEKSH